MSHNNQKLCDIEGCISEGSYLTPRSPANLTEKLSLCLKHVRSHNLNWNYFHNMSNSEIINYHKNIVYSEQQTWAFGIKNMLQEQNIHNKVREYLGLNTTIKANQAINPLSQLEKAALIELNLTYPTNKKDIKKAYKKLAKLYHPDLHPNESSKFIKIKNAYDILMSSNLIGH